MPPIQTSPPPFRSRTSHAIPHRRDISERNWRKKHGNKYTEQILGVDVTNQKRRWKETNIYNTTAAPPYNYSPLMISYILCGIILLQFMS